MTEKALPRWGYVKNKGICRVLEYHPPNSFTLLTKRDERIYVNRNRISFRGSEK